MMPSCCMNGVPDGMPPAAQGTCQPGSLCSSGIDDDYCCSDFRNSGGTYCSKTGGIAASFQFPSKGDTEAEVFPSMPELEILPDMPESQVFPAVLEPRDADASVTSPKLYGINLGMWQGPCLDDTHCEGDLVCHASNQCTCNITTNEGCPRSGQICSVGDQMMRCPKEGCAPSCSCDVDSDATDGTNGCDVGQVCRQPCAMMDVGPMCFKSNEKRDCGHYGESYICRDSNEDGIIDKLDGAHGCVQGLVQPKLNRMNDRDGAPLELEIVDDPNNNLESHSLPEDGFELLSEGGTGTSATAHVPQLLDSPSWHATLPNGATFPALVEVGTDQDDEALDGDGDVHQEIVVEPLHEMEADPLPDDVELLSEGGTGTSATAHVPQLLDSPSWHATLPNGATFPALVEVGTDHDDEALDGDGDVHQEIVVEPLHEMEADPLPDDVELLSEGGSTVSATAHVPQLLDSPSWDATLPNRATFPALVEVGTDHDDEAVDGDGDVHQEIVVEPLHEMDADPLPDDVELLSEGGTGTSATAHVPQLLDSPSWDATLPNMAAAFDCGRNQCRSPDGVCERAMHCLIDPCSTVRCKAGTVCEANYCGGCHAVCSPQAMLTRDDSTTSRTTSTNSGEP